MTHATLSLPRRFGILASLLLCCMSAPVAALNVGDTVPAFTRPDIYQPGRQLDFSRTRGKVVYLDFWASWCGPCRKSLPALNRLYRELRGKGFQVVAVNLDEQRRDALAFLAQRPVTYPVVTDDGALAEQFQLVGMPSAFLIDRTGTVRRVHNGFRSGDEDRLRGEILQLLGDKQ